MSVLAIPKLQRRLTTWRELTLRRALENESVVDSALVLFAFCGLILALLRRRRSALRLFSRVHRSARRNSLRRLIEPYIIRHRSAAYGIDGGGDCVSLFERNRLLVLKPPLANGEKGVLLVMFSEIIEQLHSCMDMETLSRDYTLVLEPSYPGYCRAGLLQYTRLPQEVFILAPTAADFLFLTRVGANLVPVELGPCDWVDPSIAEPYLGKRKQFDIVMNAMWASLKRHYVLFRMLAHARRNYKVALIGVSWAGRSRSDIEREAAYYGVLQQLTFFESIPYHEAMEVTCRSRVSLLLSLKEAGPRAVAESIFCDVPVVVLKRLVGGIVKNVVPETGMVVGEEELEVAVERLLSADINPRRWAMDHISCVKSTQRLNALLRERAMQQGCPWTQDVVVRSNSPECTYAFEADAQRLRQYNARLRQYLRV